MKPLTAVRRLNEPYLLLYLLLFGVLVVLLPRTGYGPDLSSWILWAQHIHARGLGEAYTIPDNNYPPVYLYVLWLYGKLAGSAAAIREQVYGLRLLTLPFDVAGALLAGRLVRRPARRFAASLLLLANTAYLYNTLLWGQVDAIYTCFAFGAVLLALRQRAAYSGWLFVLALNTKLQAVLFLPGLLLLWLPLWAERRSELLRALIGGGLLQAALLLPFFSAGGWAYLGRVVAVGQHAVGYYPYISQSAYNLWHLLVGPGQVGLSDTRPYLGLTYRAWGLIWFGLAAAVILLPLARHTVRQLRGRARPLDRARVLLAFGLLPLAFCFFNTQMHERYWHGALLFLAAYGFTSGRYAAYALASGAYYLNLNQVLRAAPQFMPAPGPAVALLFAAVLLLGLYQLYQPAGASRPGLRSFGGMTNGFRPFGRYAVRRRLVSWRYGVLHGLLFSLLLVLAGPTAHQGDLEAWRTWGVYLQQHGLSRAYANPAIDYNPLYLYVLWLFGRLAGSAEALISHLHGLKAITLLFDFAGALLAASLLRGRWRQFVGSLWLLLNAGYLYNTLVWQQVDAIYTCLVFAAVLLALRQRPALSLVLYVLALNAKLQAIVFLPLLGLLWLPLLRRRPRQLLPGLGAAAAVQLLLLAPFVWGSGQSYLGRILHINFSAVSVYPYTTVNAFNIWVLLMPDALFWVPDTLRKFGLSYRHWGLLAFGGASALALAPLLLGAWQRHRGAFTAAQAPLVLLVGGLIPLVFCFFNTEMHERYWHPAVLFLGAYALVSRRWLPYALVSLGYLLNLHTMFSHYHHRPTWLVQHPQVVGAIFAAALLSGFYCLWLEVRPVAARPVEQP
ncbi:hypothetical protein EJV47_11745 [Hymenobacter gummosus]|uniref:DUF2029 domain-containing protein n=1 Tax=Hymenobacter gummosus TaxID=1776032 RepID=A0A3S0QIM5_9BACT|nr:hypothetical protein [Hymenobacter gummosus]RTQ50291.1 hypothetical protein EJV47_11745 [Hymenobacter gummosus]